MSERDAFIAGFEYAEDVGKTTTKKVYAEALRRYPDAPPPGDGGLREAIEKHRRALEADNPGSSTLGHESYDDELYAALGRPAQTQLWRCTNCGTEVKDADVIAHADLPTTIKLWHKNTDGIWCGPVEPIGEGEV